MWSPTKFDFPFYDFSMIYYDFFDDSVKINKKEKDKTTIQNRLRGLFVRFWKVWGCRISGFIGWGVK